MSYPGKQPLRWVIGLGNPGRRYATTRHNIGFMVLDELAARAGASFGYRWLYAASCATLPRGGTVLVKPETYMNRSGKTVGRLMFWRRMTIGRMIVVVDDTALSPGCVRVRAKGGAGGHNGLKSVIGTLGSEAFVRVRVGIGKCAPGETLVEYVLSEFSPVQMPEMEKGIKAAADAVEFIEKNGVEKAMNAFN
jgi:PTH1 family peptidyl-tRNA hydrolase